MKKLIIAIFSLFLTNIVIAYYNNPYDYEYQNNLNYFSLQPNYSPYAKTITYPLYFHSMLRSHPSQLTMYTITPFSNNRNFYKAKKPFYPQIVSDKKISAYSNNRYGNIYNVTVGEQIKFYPDYTSIKNYKNTTWKWHYDSRGLQCSESGNQTLTCTVIDTVQSDVWAEFFVPEEIDPRFGEIYESNVIKLYPQSKYSYDSRFLTIDRTPINYQINRRKIYHNYNQLPYSYFYYFGY